MANNPEDSTAGMRQVPFSREIYIEQDDFREVPPPKYYRLSPGKEVRLRNAYFITAQNVVKDADGNVVEVHCTYDPASRGGNFAGWEEGEVDDALGVGGACRFPPRYGFTTSCFRTQSAGLPEGGSFLDNLNPDSLEVMADAKLEPSLAKAKLGRSFQFERVGYFCLDPDSTAESWCLTGRWR